MDKLFAAGNFLKYQLRAKDSNDIHSPFVFDLLNSIILDKTPFYGFDLIESLRAQYLLSDTKINVTDFGTGNNQRKVLIRDIAMKAVKPKKYGQLLFRLVNKFSTENILEFGTSLGITSLYLSMPDKNNRVITLEGSYEIAAIAKEGFDKLKRKNIEIIVGEFDESLPKVFDKFKRLDLVFFDGNHRREPTLTYFEKCLKLITENSIFIFDDIHWSREMEMAWNEIKENPSVTVSIDLFQLGIIFFRKGMVKQHFTLQY